MSIEELSKTFEALKIPKTHISVGFSNLISSHKSFRTLLVNRRLPDHGWSDQEIQWLLYTLSTLDTNNKRPIISSASSGRVDTTTSRWCGVGEREGRVYSGLVAQRHFGFSHGIGRSGDIAEPQPKAVGSSILAQLTLCLTMDAVRRGSGLNAQTAAKNGILLPLCTGMSVALVLSSFRTTASAEDESKRDIVLWSRIDQKSCFKAVTSAGLIIQVVPTKCVQDNVVTDVDAMRDALETYKNRVLAIITTTSCFAPRVPDSVDQVAILCSNYGVNHVINNAYGLQCAQTCRLINRACVVGRVDAIVSSTDKNFLVPVGGAIVLSPIDSVVTNIGKFYAGRASATPMLDLFITLLSMGMNGYKDLLEQRQHLLKTFPQKLQAVAEQHGERLLLTPTNTISFGITLDGLARPQKKDDENEVEYLNAVAKDISMFGAMLFNRCVSGTRVVPRGQLQCLGGVEFQGFGSSATNYPHAYMTAACAIGLTESEMDEFLVRLDKLFKDVKKSKQEMNQA
jgi:O-phospho-L-seryl-tRNASec:L-selenocysteinyl-tRNA synthase